MNHSIRIAIAFVAVMSAGCPKESGHDHPAHGEQERENGAKEGHDDHSGEKHGDHGDHDVHEKTVELTPEMLARIDIETTKVERKKFSTLLETTARVGYDETRIAHVGPRIPGRVRKVSKTLGDMVVADEPLATLDSVALGEAIAQQRAAVVEEELARKTLARERTLLAEKLSSEQSVLEAESAHKKALAAKRVAQEQLRLYGGRGSSGSTFELRAPIDGKIVEQHLTLGELVTPEDKVYTIADLSALWIWVDVFERDLGRVHIDDEATVLTDAYGGETFTGKVAYIMDRVDPDTRAVRARIDVANPDGRLKPGMFATVTLSDPHADESASLHPEVVAVPPEAVQRDGDAGWIAFVRVGERSFERRRLELGRRTSQYVEVRSGLSPAEEVVTKSAFLLKSEAEKGAMGGGHSH